MSDTLIIVLSIIFIIFALATLVGFIFIILTMLYHISCSFYEKLKAMIKKLRIKNIEKDNEECEECRKSDDNFISLNEVAKRLGVYIEHNLNSIYSCSGERLYTDVSMKMSDYNKLKEIFDKVQCQKQKDEAFKEWVGISKEDKDE